MRRGIIPWLGVPPAVVPIYVTTFVDMLGYTLLIPLLPGLAHKYHAPDWLVGMLLSVPALCATVAAPAWGKTSDRWGRKSIIVIAQAFSLIGYAGLALAPDFAWVFAARVVSGVGAGSLGAAESYIADVTEDRQRDRAYSLYGAAFGAAFVIGPASAGYLQRYGVQFPFFVAALLEALNIALTLWLLPGRLRRSREATGLRASLAAAMRTGVRRVLVRQFLFVFSVVYLLAAFGLFVADVLHRSLIEVGGLLAGAGVAGGATMLFVVTPLSKRIGNLRLGQTGLVLLFAAYLGLCFVPDAVWFLAVLLAWAAGAAMVEPTLMTLLSERAPQRERGAIMGLSDAVNSVAMIVAPGVATAIVGVAAHAFGLLPAGAVAVAWVLGRLSLARQPRKAAADRKPVHRSGQR